VQDSCGRLLSSWTIANADEERLVLAQFTRFGVTRKVAERFLAQMVQQQQVPAAAAAEMTSSADDDAEARRKQFAALQEQMAAAALFERLRARHLALQAAVVGSDPAAAGLLFPYAAGYSPAAAAGLTAAAAAAYPYGPIVDFSLRSLHQPPLIGSGSAVGGRGLETMNERPSGGRQVDVKTTPVKAQQVRARDPTRQRRPTLLVFPRPPDLQNAMHSKRAPISFGSTN